MDIPFATCQSPARRLVDRCQRGAGAKRGGGADPPWGVALLSCLGPSLAKQVDIRAARKGLPRARGRRADPAPRVPMQWREKEREGRDKAKPRRSKQARGCPLHGPDAANLGRARLERDDGGRAGSKRLGRAGSERLDRSCLTAPL